MSSNKQDIKYMRRAIELSKNGRGFVHPNPLVGCVIVKNDEVIGEGWHEYFGGPHAERNAINNCITNPEDASLYVTLEPCCHYGKTPPCTNIIVEKGIKKVMVGLLDPNPFVAGKGVALLQKAGIEVVSGIEEDKIREVNKVFLKYITTKLPYVIMKTAMTIDGKIATYTGDSKWITNEESKKTVHRLRNEVMGIAVGIGTVIADDPLLNCRLEGRVHQPIRVIVDSKASISLDSQIVKTANEYKTIVAHTNLAISEKIKELNEFNVETLCCKNKDSYVDIKDLMVRLGAKGIDSLLLEGGATLNAAFLQDGCVDELYSFIAPKIIGGQKAKTPVGGKGIAIMKDAITLKNIKIQNINGNILITGKIS